MGLAELLSLDAQWYFSSHNAAPGSSSISRVITGLREASGPCRTHAEDSNFVSIMPPTSQ